MKGLLSVFCALLVLAVLCSASYGKSSPAKATKPAMRTMRTNMPAGSAKAAKPAVAAVPATGNVMPNMPAAPAAVPADTTQPSMPATAPAAGPAMSGTTAAASGPALTSDSSFVYVLQEGKLYKFPKNSLSACGTAVPTSCAPCPPAACNPCPPTCTPCPTGAGPVCPSCTGMTFIPGFGSSTCTVTTITPCPQPATTGAGPCAPSCTTAPCPVPSTTVTCTPNVPAVCNPCPTPNCTPCDPCNKCRAAATYASTSTTMQCGPCVGAGPCAIPAIATLDSCGQALLDCINAVCGAEADKAYLTGMVQINRSVLALSDASAVHLGSTSLQNYATNSIGDSQDRISTSMKYLRNKYCLAVSAGCPPSLGGLNICNINQPGREFDEAYKAQLIQYYVDEIAISQAEIDRGLDCQVKQFAATTIKQDQDRINRLQRCGVCNL